MELTQKDLHCIARQLQGAYFKNDLYFCCNSSYCRYAQDCIDEHRLHNSKLRERMEKATGVYLGFLIDDRYVAERMLDASYVAVTGRQVSPQGSLGHIQDETVPSGSESL